MKDTKPPFEFKDRTPYESSVDAKSEQDKKSSIVTRISLVSVMVSMFAAYGISYLIEKIVLNSIEAKGYIPLYANNFDYIPILVLTVGIDILIGIAALNIILKKKDLTTLIEGKTAKIICAVLGTAIIIGGCVFTYFDAQKNIALGENDIYICEQANKEEYVKYDDIKFYEVYYSDDEVSQYILVKDNDYTNYSIFDKSDNMSDEAEKIFDKNVKVQKTFSSFEDFRAEFGVE